MSHVAGLLSEMRYLCNAWSDLKNLKCSVIRGLLPIILMSIFYFSLSYTPLPSIPSTDNANFS